MQGTFILIPTPNFFRNRSIIRMFSGHVIHICKISLIFKLFVYVFMCVHQWSALIAPHTHLTGSHWTWILLIQAGWLLSLRNPPDFTSPALDTHRHTSFLCGCPGPNSGPQGYTASALPTEYSLVHMESSSNGNNTAVNKMGSPFLTGPTGRLLTAWHLKHTSLCDSWYCYYVIAA